VRVAGWQQRGSRSGSWRGIRRGIRRGSRRGSQRGNQRGTRRADGARGHKEIEVIKEVEVIRRWRWR
jgi:hypothetical protein